MAIEIRKETSGDIAEIAMIVAAAFDSADEPQLVSLIRDRKQDLISLVAEEDGVLLGHVLVSPIEIYPATQQVFAAVGPLAVLPNRQGDGIGSALMEAAIERSRELGVDALFLLGHTEYYPRFGFETSHIGNEYGATEAFMHLELSPQCLRGVSGVAKYVSAFKEVDA